MQRDFSPALKYTQGCLWSIWDAYRDNQTVCIDPGHSEDREQPSADSDRHHTDSTQRGRVREHSAVLEQTPSNVGKAAEWGQK